MQTMAALRPTRVLLISPTTPQLMAYIIIDAVGSRQEGLARRNGSTFDVVTVRSTLVGTTFDPAPSGEITKTGPVTVYVDMTVMVRFSGVRVVCLRCRIATSSTGRLINTIRRARRCQPIARSTSLRSTWGGRTDAILINCTSTNSASIKVALYTVNELGEPGGVIGGSNTGTALTTGLNIIPWSLPTSAIITPTWFYVGLIVDITADVEDLLEHVNTDESGWLGDDQARWIFFQKLSRLRHRPTDRRTNRLERAKLGALGWLA